jgi:hypothetical protein
MVTNTACVFISSVTVTSTPPDASHRLRLWIRTPAAPQSPSSSVNSLENHSFIYQRLWKSDSFKLGSELNFQTLSSKLVMGVRDARGPQVQATLQKTFVSAVARTPQWIAENRPSNSSYYNDGTF